MDKEMELRSKYKSILSFLNEKQRRLYLSIEAAHFGYGGVTKVSKLSGISRVVITKGQKELQETQTETIGKSRKPGGGRKKKINKYNITTSKT